MKHHNPQGVSPRNCAFVKIGGEIIDPDTGTVAGVNTTCVEQGVNYAYSPTARADAAADLTRFLGTIFSP